MFFSSFESRLRVVPLSLSPSCVTREKTARKKWPREILGTRSAREDYRLWSHRVWPFTAEWFFGVGFPILTSSYYRLLSITQGDILNKIALLYASSNEAKTYAVRSIVQKYRSVFVQCSFSETAKEVLKRRRQIRHLVTIFAPSVGVNLKVIAKISNAEVQPRIYIM